MILILIKKMRKEKDISKEWLLRKSEKSNKQLIMTKDGMLSLLIAVVISFVIWLKLKNSIFEPNLFKIVCWLLIFIILVCIFWKRIKYLKSQISVFLSDMLIVWFVSLLISLVFVNSYRINGSKCICKPVFLREPWNLRCICDNIDLLWSFFVIFVLIYLLWLFLLIFLLPECKDD